MFGVDSESSDMASEHRVVVAAHRRAVSCSKVLCLVRARGRIRRVTAKALWVQRNGARDLVRRGGSPLEERFRVSSQVWTPSRVLASSRVADELPLNERKWLFPNLVTAASTPFGLTDGRLHFVNASYILQNTNIRDLL